MKYYYEGDKIIATYQGGLVSNDPNSRGHLSLSQFRILRVKKPL